MKFELNNSNLALMHAVQQFVYAARGQFKIFIEQNNDLKTFKTVCKESRIKLCKNKLVRDTMFHYDETEKIGILNIVPLLQWTNYVFKIDFTKSIDKCIYVTSRHVGTYTPINILNIEFSNPEEPYRHKMSAQLHNEIYEDFGKFQNKFTNVMNNCLGNRDLISGIKAVIFALTTSSPLSASDLRVKIREVENALIINAFYKDDMKAFLTIKYNKNIKEGDSDE